MLQGAAESIPHLAAIRPQLTLPGIELGFSILSLIELHSASYSQSLKRTQALEDGARETMLHRQIHHARPTPIPATHGTAFFPNRMAVRL